MYDRSDVENILIDVKSFSLYMPKDIRYIVLNEKGNKFDESMYGPMISIIYKCKFSQTTRAHFDKIYQTLEEAEQDYLRLINYFEKDFKDLKLGNNRIFIPVRRIEAALHHNVYSGAELDLDLGDVPGNLPDNLRYVAFKNVLKSDFDCFIAQIESLRSKNRQLIQSYSFINLPEFSCYTKTSDFYSLLLFNSYNKDSDGTITTTKPAISISTRLRFCLTTFFSTFDEAKAAYAKVKAILDYHSNEFIEVVCDESKIYTNRNFDILASYQIGHKSHQKIKVEILIPSKFGQIYAPSLIFKYSNSEDIKHHYLALVDQIRNKQALKASRPQLASKHLFWNDMQIIEKDAKDAIEKDWVLINHV